MAADKPAEAGKFSVNSLRRGPRVPPPHLPSAAPISNQARVKGEILLGWVIGARLHISQDEPDVGPRVKLPSPNRNTCASRNRTCLMTLPLHEDPKSRQYPDDDGSSSCWHVWNILKCIFHNVRTYTGNRTVVWCVWPVWPGWPRAAVATLLSFFLSDQRAIILLLKKKQQKNRLKRRELILMVLEAEDYSVRVITQQSLQHSAVEGGRDRVLSLRSVDVDQLGRRTHTDSVALT